MKWQIVVSCSAQSQSDLIQYVPRVQQVMAYLWVIDKMADHQSRETYTKGLLKENKYVLT